MHEKWVAEAEVCPVVPQHLSLKVGSRRQVCYLVGVASSSPGCGLRHSFQAHVWGVTSDNSHN